MGIIHENERFARRLVDVDSAGHSTGARRSRGAAVLVPVERAARFNRDRARGLDGTAVIDHRLHHHVGRIDRNRRGAGQSARAGSRHAEIGDSPEVVRFLRISAVRDR